MYSRDRVSSAQNGRHAGRLSWHYWGCLEHLAASRVGSLARSLSMSQCEQQTERTSRVEGSAPAPRCKELGTEGRKAALLLCKRNVSSWLARIYGPIFDRTDHSLGSSLGSLFGSVLCARIQQGMLQMRQSVMLQECHQPELRQQFRPTSSTIDCLPRIPDQITRQQWMYVKQSSSSSNNNNNNKKRQNWKGGMVNWGKE